MTIFSLLQKTLQQRIMIMDGAMGTMIQQYALSEEEYCGERLRAHCKLLQGNNDLLSITKPDVIQAIHRAYLEAGADFIETNTFNANSISQSDYDLSDLSYELNYASAKIAKAVATEISQKTPEIPRYVVGALGPTNRTASISPDVNNSGARNITFPQLVDAYTISIKGLLDGGADLLMVETIFDTLNAKAALFAIEQYFEQHGVCVPIMISGTITDASGRTLSGQTTEAFWNSLAHARPLSIGLNCALCVTQLRQYVEEMARVANVHVSCHPNAGLPNEFGGYDESPEFMAKHIREWAESNFLNIVGGCCGTTPPHIAAIAKAVGDVRPRAIPDMAPACRLAGLEPLNITDDSMFVNVGERTNVTGSAAFKKLVLNNEYDKALEVGGR